MAKGKKKNKVSKEDKRRKKAGKKGGVIKPPSAFDGPGDLRAVEYHVQKWQAGTEEALNMLLMLGRDAAFIVNKMAEAQEDQELLEFARRLVAIPPQVETNLYELRAASVNKIVDDAMAKAPNAVEAKDLVLEGGAIGIFDPKRIATEIAKGGRVRKDVERVAKGDIAMFGLHTSEGVPVRFSTTPAPEHETLSLRLAVDSGIVFVGPPDASDGPRLGTLRLDPFSTGLNQYLKSGTFLRIKPGVYRVAAYVNKAGEVQIHLGLDEAPEANLGLDLKQLSLPRQ